MLSFSQRTSSATILVFVVGVAQGAAPPSLPPQSVFIDPLSFAVLGQNATFRDSAFDSGFNPSSTPTPFFQILDAGFLDILGPEPSFHEIASNPDFGFANEAPVYVPDTDEIFFSGSPFPGNTNVSNQVNRVSMSEVEDALRASNGSAVNVTVTPINLPSTVLSTNGGTGPFRGSLLFVGDGLGARPPAVTLVNPRPPHNATVLLDNYFGRQFNSLNDVKIHPTSGKIFFSDVSYGFALNIRPAPLMPNQVYRFDPDTRVVQMVLDGLVRPNGIAFTQDGRMAYVSDSGSLQDLSGTTALQTQPATIYAFDIDPVTERFINRRVLAYIDAGVPDGLQVDTNGNIYAATGDGVQVWTPAGTLLGKFFVGMRTANMVFAGFGRLVLLSETRLFLARVNAGNVNLEGR
ncbi:calcium-dependent phosphotriesterase [Pleurotus eryngii]|uniref:Calcium-dependent phosphotriesterase n=1 Tax=Pleurotus eryngii TaxID=5323 RepID=A0A9P6DG62_PLEER|nr:calcium-dependent phosphotriesterase [Pleurotus eryngii]